MVFSPKGDNCLPYHQTQFGNRIFEINGAKTQIFFFIYFKIIFREDLSVSLEVAV